MSRKYHAALALVGSYVAFCGWWLMGVPAAPGTDWLAIGVLFGGAAAATIQLKRALS